MYTLVLLGGPWRSPEARKSQAPSRVRISGASVAEAELVRQLATHSRADRIVTLVSRIQDDDAQSAWIMDCPQVGRIETLPCDRLGQLRGGRGVVLFSLDSVILRGAHARAAFGQPHWVVSGVTHALSSYDAVCHVMMLRTYHMRPHDSLICTSVAAREALRRLLDGTRRSAAGDDDAEAVCPIQLPIIPLPVPSGSPERTSSGRCRACLGFVAGEVVFLSVGRFSVETKADLNPLLIAFADVSRRCKHARLVIAGDDGQKQAARLTGLADQLGLGDVVHIKPDPTLEEKTTLYAAADVFVSLSDNVQESFGLTLLEAMQAGLPVIASSWSGYRDIVRDGKTGFLIPSYWAACGPTISTAMFADEWEPHWAAAQTVAVDVEATVQAMVVLASDAGMRARMGADGKAAVRRTFAGESVVRQYEDLWMRSIEAGQSSQAVMGADRETSPFDYFKTFGHFASHLVSDATTFRLSSVGARVLSGELRIEALDQPRGGFTPVVFGELLRLADEDPERISWREECDTGRRRHLLRLAKYGLLEIVDTANACVTAEEPSSVDPTPIE
jgi:glycosyltransferase involved in cell wall biosynthesis